MDTSGFYKIINDKFECRPDIVTGADYELTRELHSTYSYPIDGWIWYDSHTQALGILPVSHNKRHITQLAFLTRFTDAEAIGIDLQSQGATVNAASMRRYLNKVTASQYIDLDHPETRAGVIALESYGLLGPGRALEILDTVTIQKEWYIK